MVRERPHHTHSLRRHPSTATAICVASTAAALWLASRATRRFVVTGESMLPALHPGDRVVAVHYRRVRIGDVVAVPDPRDRERLLVKRVHSLTRSTAELRGDNEAGSTDSRVFGPVPVSALIGRVVYRYGPPERVGWLR